MRKCSLAILMGLIICAPTIASAVSLVPCQDNCGFDHLVVLAQNILNFIVTMSTMVAAAMFAFAGFLYFTAGGDKGKISKTHKIFTNTAIGIVVILVAWLLIDTILQSLTDRGLDDRARNPSGAYHIDIERRIG